MTRARALKVVIRARAGKTGERYTTARRHVLNSLRARPEPIGRAPVSLLKPRLAAASASSKGGVSEAKAREKTGHGLDYWFEVLDRFGGTGTGHTALARHLYDAHSVPGWYAQGITVAYERARGARAINQRCDGEYEVSASKIVYGRTPATIKAFTDTRVRKRWTADVDATLVTALAAALDAPASKRIVVRPDGQGRFRYRWGDTTVQLYFYPKPGDKTSVVVTNSKLTDGPMVEERRGLWRAALDRLARHFERP